MGRRQQSTPHAEKTLKGLRPKSTHREPLHTKPSIGGFGLCRVYRSRSVIASVRRLTPDETLRRHMTDADDLSPASFPRCLNLVRFYFDFDFVPNDYHAKYLFMDGRNYIFFGEIPNMPGHCVMADH